MNAEFKDHFSSHAAGYARARPSYPGELFSWLATTAPSHDLAVDLATGNGQAACGLAAHFEQVVATDASSQQIVAAEPHVRVEYRCEPAEACSLPDHAVDLITVAQAAHWLDHARFYVESRRLLKADGVLAVWCYGANQIEPAIDVLFQRFYDSLDAYWPEERVWVAEGYRSLPFPLDEIEAPAFEIRCDWTCDQFLAYLRSWSATQRATLALGRDPVVDIESELSTLWRSASRRVRWPISLRVGRFR